MKELRRKKKVILIYTVQAQIMLNAMKDMSIDKFEKEFLNEVKIGDKVITQYILEKGLKQEKKDGTKL